MTRPRIWSVEIIKFVRDRAMGENINWEAIARDVNAQWPGSAMTRQAARRIGKEYKHRTPRAGRADAPPMQPQAVQCGYKWLEGGKLHVCEAEGYPHCANHKKKLTQVSSGSRFASLGGLKNVY